MAPDHAPAPWEAISRAFDAMPVGVGLWSAEGVLLHANPVLCDLLDEPLDDLIGKGIDELVDGEDTALAGSLAELRDGRRNSVGCVIQCRRPDGTEVGLTAQLTSVFGPGGRPLYLTSFVFEFVDVTDVRRRTELIGTHDPLTGLANRALLHDLCELALARLRRYDNGVSLMFIDLDGFKEINDQLGHQWGDDVLHQIARRIESSIRESDAAARVGGDEFVVLVEDDDSDLVMEVAARILAAIREPFDVAGRRLSISASIGIAEVDDPRTTVRELLAGADAAMYRAKARGGGQIAGGGESREDATQRIPPQPF